MVRGVLEEYSKQNKKALCVDLENALDKYNEKMKKSEHVSCLLGPANNCEKSLLKKKNGKISNEQYVFNDVNNHHSEQRILKRYLSQDNREDWDKGTNEDTCYPGSLKPVFV